MDTVDLVSSAGASTKPLRERIEERLHNLSKKQRQVGEYILAHPAMTLFATAAEIAQRAEVDPATVVRFAQTFGFPGFTEFREELRSEFPFRPSPLERLDEDIAGAASANLTQLLARVRARALENLEKTFEQLDWRAIDATLTYLLSARRVIAVGAGQSRVVAMHVHRVLQTTQISSQLMEDWYDLLYDVANFGPEDVVFGVTVWRYSKVTVESLRLAREAGAKTILLTDARLAPGADIADVTLLFAPHAIGEYLSPVAGTAIVDCLAAGLAARAPDRVKRAMALQYEISSTNGLSYW